MPQKQTPLQPFSSSAIPESLKALKRWAPWKAVWSEKRGKYDKIPYRADAPNYGLSTARPDSWFSFEAAQRAFDTNPNLFHGLGFVLTGIKGVVGTDLDGCVNNGVIADWAKEIVGDLNSYTEISPSGTGLRVFNTGKQDDDWNNHDVGIEVYGGNDARFLTVSGQHLQGTPTCINEASSRVLQTMATKYAKARTKATIIDLNLPEVLDDLALPDISALGLPYKITDFLLEGGVDGDRSNMVFAAGCALYSAGLTDAEVFSTLINSPYAMEVALDHRRQDQDRAAMYLWREHCLKAKARATSKIASPEDFEDIAEKLSGTVLDDFEDVSGGVKSTAAPKAAPPKRFAFVQAGAFAQVKSAGWHIKGVLPRAEVVAVIGESGSGKTFFVLDMLMSVALGGTWRGRRVKQCAVAYICAEGSDGFRKRLNAYCIAHDLNLDDIPLYILGVAPNLMEKGDVKDLLAAIAEIPGDVGLVCADTLAQVTAGANENSGEDMGRALGHCKLIHKMTKATVALVAHTGKVADRGLRGWSGVKAALDAEITVERSAQYRSATITKLKDGSDEGVEFAFELETVGLGEDEDGDPISSCVVRAKENVSRADRKVAPKGEIEKLVMRVATNLGDMAGGFTQAELIEAAICEIPETPGKRDQRKTVVSRAITSLSAGNWIAVNNGTVEIK